MENQFLDSNLDTAITPQYYEYAGFWQRFVATVIDGFIIGIAQSIILAVFGISLFSVDPEVLADGIPASFSIAYLISFGLQIAYYAYFESSEKQATFGKQAMGLVVTDMNGQRITLLNAVGRYFAKLVSGITLLIGYLMQPFTQKKQALHDMIAGTLVYRK